MSQNTARSTPALASLGVGAFAQVTAEFLPVAALPEVAHSFSVTDGTAGLMMTLPGILAVLSAPGVLLLSGRTNRRAILLGLTTLLVLSTGVSTYAREFWVLFAGRAGLGVSLGGFWALSLAVASRLVEADRVPKAAAVVFGGVTAAMILGVPLGEPSPATATDTSMLRRRSIRRAFDR